ncbi:MAG: DUF4912 domain-containing protein [Thermodesulfobacteriota bacterium]
MASLPQDLVSLRAVGGAVQAAFGVATGALGALFAAGGSLIGVATRLLELAGVISPTPAADDVEEPPSLRALAGGVAVRSRRGDGEDVEASTPRRRGRGAALDDASLPERYDEDRVVVLPRDPSTVYVYWNLSEASRRRREAAIAAAGTGPLRDALQIELTTETDAEHAAAGHAGTAAWTVPLAPLAESAYVDLQRRCRAVRAVLGVLGPAGDFLALVASGRTTVPPARPAAEKAPTWRQLAPPGQHAAEPPTLPSRDAREALLRRAQESQMTTSSTGRLGHAPRGATATAPARGA